MKTSKKKFKNIGVLGGTFDPPHFGHLRISTFSIKKLKLEKLIWAVTKKNPFKQKPVLSLKKRINLFKKITNKTKKIKVMSFDHKIKSSRSIDLIKFLIRKNVNLFFLIGSDNLVNLHKWEHWEKIGNFSKIVVFPRSGYIKKILTSRAYRKLGKKSIILIKSKMVNISSSKIRKNYLKFKN